MVECKYHALVCSAGVGANGFSESVQRLQVPKKAIGQAIACRQMAQFRPQFHGTQRADANTTRRFNSGQSYKGLI